MHVEFRKCNLSKEIEALKAFDRKVFPRGDLFSTKDWREYVPYWMLVDGVAVGCCAFQHNMDFQEDLSADEENMEMEGCLYIATTGILPTSQAKGLGQLLKSWEIAYAKYHGFRRIVTNTRKRNQAMILLNRKFGFRTVRVTPHYYSGPADATVVMELKF